MGRIFGRKRSTLKTKSTDIDPFFTLRWTHISLRFQSERVCWSSNTIAYLSRVNLGGMYDGIYKMFRIFSDSPMGDPSTRLVQQEPKALNSRILSWTRTQCFITFPGESEIRPGTQKSAVVQASHSRCTSCNNKAGKRNHVPPSFIEHRP